MRDIKTDPYSLEEAQVIIDKAKKISEKLSLTEKITKEQAIKSFADHKLKIICNTKEVQMFECRNKDGSWCYGFRAVFADNLICMHGDCGELLINPGYNRDGLRWMRGSINSIGYFREKFDQPYVEDTREFSNDIAVDNLLGCIHDDIEEVVESYQYELKLIEKCLETEFETEYEFHRYAFDECACDEPWTATRVKASFWYRYYALKRLCDLLDEVDFKIGVINVRNNDRSSNGQDSKGS